MAIVPASKLIDWSSVGVSGGIPTRTTIGITATDSPYNADNTGTVDAKAAIQSAMDATPSGQVCSLPAGTYDVSGPLDVPSNITVRGAGVNQTIINITGAGAGLFRFGTSGAGFDPTTYTETISSGATDGSTSIVVSDGTSFTTGDLVVISETNGTNVSQVGGLGTATWVDGWNTSGDRARGQIVEVTNIATNTLTITPALYSDYTNTPWASHLTPGCESSGLEDFTIYANDTDMFRNVLMQRAKDCWVYNVELDFSDGDPITIDWSLRCEIRKCDIHDAYIHQSGTYDSQLSLRYKTSECLIVDNILYRLHTAIMLEWGAAGNVVAYNYSAGHFDIDSGPNPPYAGQTHLEAGINPNHGAHPQFNLFEGNICQKISIDYFWGTSSHQTFLRNWAKGYGEAFAPWDGRGAYDTENPRAMTQSNRAFDVWDSQTNISLVGNVAASTDRSGTVARIDAGNGDTRSYTTWYPFSYGYSSDGQTTNTPTVDPTTTLIDEGNYDEVNDAQVWTITPETIPDSYYLASKPDWFGGLAWPPIQPDTGFTQYDSIIPAGYRFTQGNEAYLSENPPKTSRRNAALAMLF
jgi:hypothetical protein